MKMFVLAVSMILAATAQAASPFTGSGEVIRTIFQSPLVWNKLGGAVETIQFLGYANKIWKYSFSTTETVSVIDARGITTGYRKVPCTLVVEVTNTAADVFVPKLEVTKTDFAACPETSI